MKFLNRTFLWLLSLIVLVCSAFATVVALMADPPFAELQSVARLFALFISGIACIVLAKPLWRARRLLPRIKLMHSLCAGLLAPLLLLFFGSRPAQAATDSLYGQPLIETNVFFTNMLAGVGGLKNTNALFQITNGSTTVTSAPVALRGYGIGLELALAFTNALVTNVVTEYQFSMDGVNWASEPTFTWRTATAAHAVGRFTALTNIGADVHRNFKFMRLNVIRLTNGVDNVGSVFSTGRPPVRVVQRYDNL